MLDKITGSEILVISPPTTSGPSLTTVRPNGSFTSEVAVVLAHEHHEVAVHAQDDEQLQLLLSEKRVALREHVIRAAYSTRSQKDSAFSAPIWPEEQDAINGMKP